MKDYKKLLLAGVIAGICSGSAVAADDSSTTEAKEGVRFAVPIGPFYDPIFDLAGSVIPTMLYETTPGAKTSSTKLFGIYGTNGNWVVRAESNNYFGANSDWLVTGMGNYTYAKLDVMDFMGLSGSPTVEVEQDTLIIEGTVQYQIFEDAYFGPAFSYTETEFTRDDPNPFGSINMITDKTITSYGAVFTFDNRDNEQTPTSGYFAKIQANQLEVENTNGAVIPDFVPVMGGFSLNGDEKYANVKADFRTYAPIGDDTTFAFRAKAHWNDDEAQTTVASLDSVAYGFTMEIAGRSAIGTDLQLRHWLTEKVGVVGTVGLAKAIDVNETTGDDSVHYAVGGGLRYMLVPEDKLSMRLDVTYNDQEEDNVLVFFNVSEAF
ncbi:outer membrane protein assembly factor [Photobacterium sagamiensis]|uniref:BamA/TamA family outer membrane protein n=1 Tax=Photobacterium sagamiensis TaxID=2910241 RepID=UPI003D1507E5